MKVFRDLDRIRIDRPVATIGIFDGVHLAHQSIISKLRQTAAELKGETSLITLWPHPRIVLQKDADNLQFLNTQEEKVKRLENAGIDNLIIIPFSREFANLDFSEFVRSILVEKIGIIHLVVGFNHQFGRDRNGNYEKLQKLSEELGFGLSQQEPVIVDNEKVSSSSIRDYINSGDISKANRFLGYNYRLNGTVVGGNQKGRELGFPTANIQVRDRLKLVPCDGVYAVLAIVEGKTYEAMMNIGCRPTFHEDCEKAVVEAHLLDYYGDLYQKEIEIEFFQRIRDEKKFKSEEMLRAQIEEDRKLVKEILASVK
jgi:riboflavin kinase / FMN adenylyltransferase